MMMCVMKYSKERRTSESCVTKKKKKKLRLKSHANFASKAVKIITAL